MKDSPFYKQAELMLRTVPAVAGEKCFALKGGTAINLFVRDMPRLSIDIDLTYEPIDPRAQALRNIDKALKRVAAQVRKTIPRAHVHESIGGGGHVEKLFVSTPDARVKIEPNTVLRGVIFPTEDRDLVKPAEELFELSASMKTLSLPDLYGGKLCAALDRQHPRDIFDVKLLMENEGITDEIRKAFVVYLASHDRPMNELIDPLRQDMRRIFDAEFSGMTAQSVNYEELLAAREQYIAHLKASLTEPERAFLVSIKEGAPKWELMGIAGIDRLPAIQWKLINIGKMSAAKHADALNKLKEKLGV